MTHARTVIVDLLASGHAVRFQARGDSMYPLIRDHDYLHVEPCAEVRVGDIVLVLAERGLTAHRVVSVDGAVVVTRGDNAPAADDPVPREKVLGKVTSAIRDGREIKVKGIGLIGRIRRIGRI
ncbi:MAG TPA: S24/S26 family peptidase [Thermoanaerobaculia bacterium]|nr:S24/S26 family peptidase [Thermoanaerobaculia bacterium]